MATAVKICGITRAEDAQAAARLGAHAVGFVFYADSPRHVDAARAAALAGALPPFVTAVGLFVNPAAPEVERVLEAKCRLVCCSFTAKRRPSFARGLACPIIKAVRVRRDSICYNTRRFTVRRADCCSMLTWRARTAAPAPRSTGASSRAELPLPVILSGGLNPENVAAAIRRVAPWAVDVSSGVEASPGIKDAQKSRHS